MPISASEASARILAAVQRLASERVELMHALGRVLAEDIVAPVTLPPWANASMDGYAARAEDLVAAAARLTVVGSVAAGAFPARAIARGEAMRVMTGAPVPRGADTVVRVEDTDRGESVVEVRDVRDRGRNIRAAGEDYERDDTILRAGDEVTPAVIGVLASAGFARVPVYRSPSVAIISSGDELVPVEQFDEVRAGRRIVSSNSYSLQALVRAAGGIPLDLGIAADDPRDLRDRIEAARGFDLIITSAGISVGDHDFTRDVLAELGAELRLWKMRIRPGAPLAFGVLHGVPWIGLSGNPVSAVVTFELFVRPLIRRMLGHSALFRAPVPVILGEPVSTSAALLHFLRAVVTPSPRGYVARLAGSQSSAVLTSLARANALLVVPEERRSYDAGESLSAIPLGDALFSSASFPA